MDYFNLLNQIEDIKEDVKTINEDCCENKEIQLVDFCNVCINCGCVNSNEREIRDDFSNNAVKIIDVFNQSKSTSFYINDFGKYKGLSRIVLWSNYNHKEVEANKSYKLIEKMIKLLIPNLKANNNIGERILNHSKLVYHNLYIIEKVKSRNNIRKGLFMYSIMKALDHYEFEYDIFELLKTFKIVLFKYNKSLMKIYGDDEKVFLHKNIRKYLKIIQNYIPTYTQTDLIELFNTNFKLKLKNKNTETSINVNENSMLKGISYIILTDFITKQEAYNIFDITSITLNKCLNYLL